MSRFQVQAGFMKVLAVLALALLFTACGGNSGGTGQKPNITSFTATPPTIDAGQASTLTWTVTGDAPITLTINQGVGTVTGQTSKEVSPTTTTYTLTAKNSAGEDTETVTVTVNSSQACTDPVAIPDANLEQAIRETLGKASGNLTCADMASLTELRAREQNISSLEGLQHAVNLVWLDLDKNEVSDVAPLVGLNKLELLNLNNNQISDLTLFANFTSLRDLYICCSNTYTDISPLASLTNLEELAIGGQDRGGISILANLDNLKSIWVESNDLDDADMSVFEGKDLELLNLADNNVTNLDFLTDFTELMVLNLRDNDITDISALVDNSGIGDGDIVDISNNLLDLDDPDVQADIQALLDRGVDLTYEPQGTAP